MQRSPCVPLLHRQQYHAFAKTSHSCKFEEYPDGLPSCVYVMNVVESSLHCYKAHIPFFVSIS